ncbi:MAG: hypothetical protein R3A44_34865 [Caldilineaceae bacterium]
MSAPLFFITAALMLFIYGQHISRARDGPIMQRDKNDSAILLLLVLTVAAAISFAALLIYVFT